MGNRVYNQPNYRGISIDSGSGRMCRVEILERQNDLFAHMLHYHSKVFYIRFDVHFPQYSQPYPTDNSIFYGFLDSLINTLYRQGLDPHYLWVREQEGSDIHHYHVSLLVDGQKTQSAYGHKQAAEELWAMALDINDARGLIHLCEWDHDTGSQNGGIMIRRDSPHYEASINVCLYRGAYLAKLDSKGNTPRGVREFGSSRVPKSN